MEEVVSALEGRIATQVDLGARCVIALHKTKFSVKGSRAFLLAGKNQLCRMGNSDLGRSVC